MTDEADYQRATQAGLHGSPAGRVVRAEFAPGMRTTGSAAFPARDCGGSCNIRPLFGVWDLRAGFPPDSRAALAGSITYRLRQPRNEVLIRRLAVQNPAARPCS